jgi:hypothetical protein
MSGGLLTSRRNLKKLHRESVLDPTPIKVNQYKNYKTVYHRIIRAAKNFTFRPN